jgi:hypothetical protein
MSMEECLLTWEEKFENTKSRLSKFEMNFLIVFILP